MQPIVSINLDLHSFTRSDRCVRVSCVWAYSFGRDELAEIALAALFLLARTACIAALIATLVMCSPFLHLNHVGNTLPWRPLRAVVALLFVGGVRLPVLAPVKLGVLSRKLLLFDDRCPMSLRIERFVLVTIPERAFPIAAAAALSA